MKLLFAAVLTASLPLAALAQAPAAKKPAAAAAAKPAAAKPAPARAAVSAGQAKALEMGIPLEDADPADKLTPAELAIAKLVYVGDIPCELGAKVVIKPRKREGYFLVTHGITRFVMHPVESRTGAIRLEDSVRGALFLQIANKSMLMNQREGKRLADECMSPEQAKVAADLKLKPINILEAAPAVAAVPAAPAAAAAPPAPAAAADAAIPAAQPAAAEAAPATTPAPAAPAPAR